MSAKKQGKESKISVNFSEKKKQVKEKYQEKHGPLIAAWERATQLAKHRAMN